MDTPTTSNTTTPALSLYSTTSTTTLVPEKTQPNTTPPLENPERDLPRYMYYKKIGTPNPDAQPKPKTKLDKLLSKFQSPAVRQTLEAREREKLEEERRGVKIYSAGGAVAGAAQATAAYF